MPTHFDTSLKNEPLRSIGSISKYFCIFQTHPSDDKTVSLTANDDVEEKDDTNFNDENNHVNCSKNTLLNGFNEGFIFMSCELNGLHENESCGDLVDCGDDTD